MKRLLWMCLHLSWGTEICYQGQTLDLLCPKSNGQLLVHSTSMPSYGHWQNQGSDICWQLSGGIQSHSCAPADQFPQILGFKQALRDSLPGIPAKDGWIRMLRLPEDPHWAVMEILPLKSDLQSLWIQEDSSSVLVLRARTEWFKRWSAKQLLPALSEEFLRRWLQSQGQTCQRIQSQTQNPDPLDLESRKIECDLSSGRWNLEVHLRQQEGATLILGYVRSENAHDRLQDLVDQIEFR